MLFAGWDVHIGKSCAQGLENSFSQTGLTKVRSSSGSLRELTAILLACLPWPFLTWGIPVSCPHCKLAHKICTLPLKIKLSSAIFFPRS